MKKWEAAPNRRVLIYKRGVVQLARQLELPRTGRFLSCSGTKQVGGANLPCSKKVQ